MAVWLRGLRPQRLLLAKQSCGRYVEVVSEERPPFPLLLTDSCSKGYRVQTYLIIIVIIVIVLVLVLF